MQLSIKALVFAVAVLWAGCLLCVGLVHLIVPTYGSAFLSLVSSIYPGFHGSTTLGDTILGTAYALIDGAVGGAVFGWLYNLAARAMVAA